ncbi:sugar phosphate isomerase/epimerase [Nakamurella silvestris]|nr:sugar phosphate isomerase/epimerase [Nakamurella silvestris]
MTRFSVNGMAAYGMALSEELAMYHRLGVRRIGLSATKLAAIGWDRAVDELSTAGAASGIDVDYLFMAFTSGPSEEGGWATELRVMSEALTAGHRLGVRTLYFTTGPSGTDPWEVAAERLGGRLAPLTALAAELGIVLAVENSMSIRSDISFVHSVADAAVLAGQLDLGLCVDLYCAWQERGLAATIRAAVDRIQLVQVSDFRVGTLTVPNRWVPGDGDLPLERMLDEVLSAGYQGPIDLELAGPAIDDLGADKAIGRGLDWLAAHARAAC